MKEKVKIKDITGARYLEKDGKFYVKVSVKKNDTGGAIDIGWFDTKKEAKEFYKELINLNK